MNKKELIQQFEKNQGWLRSKDFGYQTIVYKLLDQFIESGKVEKVKNGLYRWAENQLYDEQRSLKELYQEGVLCLFSAWYYYELSTTIPYQYHLAFPHKANPYKMDYPPIQFYYWSEKQYQLGLVKNKSINIYELEKSVCDAVKFRNKIGEDIMLEVLKNYMQRKDRNLDKLMNYAKKMRITKIISPLLKTLI